MISLTILAAIFWRQPSSVSALKNSSARRTGRALIVGSAVPPTNTNRAAFGEARAVALRAAARAEVACEFLAHGERLGLVVAPLEVRQDALELVLALHRAAARVEVAELDLLALAALHQDVARLLRQARVRRLGVEAVVVGERLDHLVVVGIAPVPAAHRAVRERELGVRDHAVRVEELLHAEAVAARAGAERVVEREQPRFELGHGVAADRGRRTCRRTPAPRASARRGRRRAPSPRRGAAPSRRIPRAAAAGPARTLRRSTTASIECFFLGSSFGTASSSTYLPSTRARTKPLPRSSSMACRCSPLRPEMTGAMSASAVPSGKREHLVDHLAHGLRREVEAVVRAARDAGARVQQAQVVVDLGDRADGRARVVRGGLLFDRDRGRESLDRIHVRLFHHRQELPRVGGQRLDVAALALGIDRVEGERRLARAGQAGEDDQAVARQVQVDVLEIVRARAADVDGLAHRGSLIE